MSSQRRSRQRLRSSTAVAVVACRRLGILLTVAAAAAGFQRHCVISAHLTSLPSRTFSFYRNDVILMWPEFPFSLVVSSKKPTISFSQCLKAMVDYMSEQLSDGNSNNDKEHDGNGDAVVYRSPFLMDNTENDNRKMALIVLNTPIRQPPSPLFRYLWKKASFRICADGGANRLYRASRQKQPTTSSAPPQQKSTEEEDVIEEYLPDVIRGDLDSLLPAVSDYYQSRGTRIERDPDQDTNDLDKALQAVFSWSTPPYRVYVYGAFGGRFDQEMASIQALYKWRETFQNQIFLYDDHTCAFLLAPGQENRIQCRYYGEGRREGQEETTDGSGGTSRLGEGPTCGLIPISGRCEFVTTSGLKWNLEGDSLEFGGLVSTSNRVMESTITVRTSHPLVFTAEVWPGDEQTF